MIITPEIAQAWLKHNNLNRPICRLNLERIKTAITTGNFIFTGDTIRFDTNGNLLDGQHRLVAVIQTGKSVESLVVFGVGQEAFSRIDTGKRRTPQDTLTIANYKHAKSTVAAVTLIDRYITNRVLQNPRYSNQEVLQLAEKYHVESYVSTWRQQERHPLIEGSLGSACQYLFDLVMNPEKVKHWLIDQVVQGVNLQQGSSALLLHQKLQQPKNYLQGKMRREYKFALIIKAFNAFATNRPIKVLRFMAAGEPEAFPEIHNFN